MPTPFQDPHEPLPITTPHIHVCDHVYFGFCDSDFCAFYSFTFSACILKHNIVQCCHWLNFSWKELYWMSSFVCFTQYYVDESYSLLHDYYPI